MTDNARAWSVLMPVKVLSQAKSRLAALAGERRGELALALACDTVTAVLACAEVARVIVITDDQVAGTALAELGALVVPDEPGDGLNAALRHGAGLRELTLARRWDGGPVRRPGRAARRGDRARPKRRLDLAHRVRGRRAR